MDDLIEILNTNSTANCTFDANNFVDAFEKEYLDINDTDLVRATQEAEKTLRNEQNFDSLCSNEKSSKINNEDYIQATQAAEKEYAEEQHLDIHQDRLEGQRFAFNEDSSYDALAAKRYAKSSEAKVKWAVDLFEEWRHSRNKEAVENPTKGISSICPGVPLCQFTKDELNFSISRFVKECRNKQGEEYPGTTLREIVLCIQMYFSQLGFNYKFLMDAMFSQIKNTLDNTMKDISAKGIGVHKKQAQVITIEEENRLWENGTLGSSTPEQLVRTIFYLNGVHFALRGGAEHRNLRIGDNSQFKIVQDSGNTEILQYAEDTSKTNQGGLTHLKIKPKIVHAYPNEDNPERCIVRLYKKYVSLCPPESNAFYRKELKQPQTSIWYSKQPKGIHTLQKMVSDICELGGLSGYRTNHSLRATAASRLYQSGVDEQLIQEVTGHRSLAVREYKRTNAVQKRGISAILGGSAAKDNKKQCTVTRSEVADGLSITLNINVSK